MSDLLTLKDVSVQIDGIPILQNVSTQLCENDWLMICGPNGAGKSTLVSALGRTVNYSGDIFLDDTNINTIKPRNFAKHVAFLSQNNYSVFDFTVLEIIEMGRYCHSDGSNVGSMVSAKQRDEFTNNVVNNALKITGLTNLASKPVTKISGGERQRTFLAQALAQQPDILVLDEPTNHLDLRYQDDLLTLVQQWKDQPNHAVISVMHDITLAKKYGTHTLLLSEGKTIASGVTKNVMTSKNLEKAFGTNVEQYMRNIMQVWC